MTFQLSDGPPTHWSPSQRRTDEAIFARAERIGAPSPSVAIPACKVDEVSRNASRDHRRKMAMTAISLLLGAGVLLAGCATAVDSGPRTPAYDYDHPAYGSLDFDYWGGWGDWHHHWDHDHDDHGRGEHSH